ncbi:MAG: sulfatase-like hydrolase/transferase [Gammaproteobacteria bacterium]|nr:sulfatase-like hydrolase/transferase [Gammaproteobacteria bacterium]
MIDFVEKLKELDRFTDSLLVFQSDHGARFSVENGKLVGISESEQSRFDTKWSRARSRSVLLIKPAGASDQELFRVSAAEVSLLDIAPTVLQSIGIPLSPDFDGNSLVDPLLTDLKQVRYYHFYNKKDPNGKVRINKMTRFRIEGDRLIKEGLVKQTSGL